MSSRLIEIFQDEALINKIKNRLPYLFHIAELENSRAGKVGMEVGSVREKIIIALLIYKFGEENVNVDLPITELEVDVCLFNQPISIKTISGKSLSGVKLIWTVDAIKSKEFYENYFPRYDLILVQITWNDTGNFFYIPFEVQQRVFNEIGKESYLKLPKAGTNPRGVEITKEALTKLVNDSTTMSIQINWKRDIVKFNPYKRWIDLWMEE